MLATARQAVLRAGLSDRIVLAQADATDFDPQTLFGAVGFDRIVISYALSMIPPWHGVVEEALRRLAPGGVLHIVDFGDQAALPAAGRTVLNLWLALFHVTPRRDLAAVLDAIANREGATARTEALYWGYAALATLRREA